MAIKKRPYSWIIFLLIFLGLGAAAFYFYLNPKKALDLAVPEFQKVGFVSAKIENDTVEIRTSLILTNKSPYELDIDTITFELKLADSTLIKQTMVHVVDLKKRQTDTIPVLLKVNHKKIRALIQRLQSQDSTTLELIVNVDYNTFLGHVSFPYSTTKTIPVPVPPKIKILDFERHKFKFSDKTMDADVHLEITNDGKLDLDINKLYYHMKLNRGLIETEGVFDQKISINPRTTKLVTIPITIKIDRPIKVYLMVLRDMDQMNYTLSLKAEINEQFLLKQTGSIEVFKEGVLELKNEEKKKLEKDKRKAIERGRR